jgi:hypothetical protein
MTHIRICEHTFSSYTTTRFQSGIDQSVQRLGYVLDDWGIMVRFPEGAKDFLFSTAFRQIGATQLPIY